MRAVEAEGLLRWVEDCRTFGQNVNDLLPQDEGRVVYDCGVFDMALGDGQLAVVEELGKGSQASPDWYLL